MMEYLGMPAEDPWKMGLTTAREGVVSLEEFQRWVLMMGGTTKLFAEILTKSAVRDPVHTMKYKLQEAGIDEKHLSFWSPTLPDSERNAVVALTPNQRHAVAHIRHLSEQRHKAALPRLSMRAKALGFVESDVYITL